MDIQIDRGSLIVTQRYGHKRAARANDILNRELLARLIGLNVNGAALAYYLFQGKTRRAR